MNVRIPQSFFDCDCLEAAPALVGKLLVRRLPDGSAASLRISETEAYRGVEDTACHAHKGRTPRTEVLYRRGGTLYVYLCYGLHHLLNIVTGPEGSPQAVLIRACIDAEGPGRLTRRLQIEKDVFNRRELDGNDALWIEDDGQRFEILRRPRVGIGYASAVDQQRLWRFCMGRCLQNDAAHLNVQSKQ